MISMCGSQGPDDQTTSILQSVVIALVGLKLQLRYQILTVCDQLSLSGFR